MRQKVHKSFFSASLFLLAAFGIMFSLISTVGLLFALWTVYVIYGAVHRLYFFPIAKFPGPKLAALTRLYELYYEIVQGGQYTFKIGELHEKYGLKSPPSRIEPSLTSRKAQSSASILGSSTSVTRIIMMSSTLEQERSATSTSTTLSNSVTRNR